MDMEILVCKMGLGDQDPFYKQVFPYPLRNLSLPQRARYITAVIAQLAFELEGTYT